MINLTIVFIFVGIVLFICNLLILFLHPKLNIKDSSLNKILIVFTVSIFIDWIIVIILSNLI